MLQASRTNKRPSIEVVDAIRAKCADLVSDAQKLWCRLVCNHSP